MSKPTSGKRRAVDPEQIQRVVEWIDSGMKPSEILQRPDCPLGQTKIYELWRQRRAATCAEGAAVQANREAS